MTQTYSGCFIESEKFDGENAERKAWDSFLGKLVAVIHAHPASRFIWRLTPRHLTDRDFERDTTDHIVVGRLIEVMGEGELPHLTDRIYENGFVTGFGLAQQKS